jgi:hypothetical protein
MWPWHGTCFRRERLRSKCLGRAMVDARAENRPELERPMNPTRCPARAALRALFVMASVVLIPGLFAWAQRANALEAVVVATP